MFYEIEQVTKRLIFYYVYIRIIKRSSYKYKHYPDYSNIRGKGCLFKQNKYILFLIPVYRDIEYGNLLINDLFKMTNKRGISLFRNIY